MTIFGSLGDKAPLLSDAFESNMKLCRWLSDNALGFDEPTMTQANSIHATTIETRFHMMV